MSPRFHLSANDGNVAMNNNNPESSEDGSPPRAEESPALSNRDFAKRLLGALLVGAGVSLFVILLQWLGLLGMAL